MCSELGCLVSSAVAHCGRRSIGIVFAFAIPVQFFRIETKVSIFHSPGDGSCILFQHFVMMVVMTTHNSY